jgi:hypothetical protein
MTKADSVLSTPRRTAPKIIARSSELSTDPIFDLIETHRNACTAHLDAIKVQNRIEKRRGIGRADWITEKPCHDENDAFAAFVEAPATTLPGLLAKIKYARSIAASEEWAWILDERNGTTIGLIESFAASLATLGIGSAA